MMIDAARWQRIQTLFHEALELPAQERPAFLESACTDDPSLAREVQTLLAEDARTSSLLDRGLDQVAAGVMDGSVPHLDRVGPYRILGEIGRGGMGVVYLAERDDLGSRAAIKVLRDAWLSPARRERFASEQRTLARLSHPGIARLYDADALPDGTPYFVMEYVPGVPLTEYCDARDAPVLERLRLFRAVCEALQYAHRHAVVHRDVKPSNILVTSDGNPKLLDFGIAKQLESVEAPALQTQTGLRAMTPVYAAPEQVRGDPVGTYTDVYALGVVLYQLLTGRLPYELSRGTPGEIESAILEQDPAPPSGAARRAGGGAAARAAALGRAGWTDLDALCLTAMQRDPQQRYRTVDALARDVEHFLRGEPLDARPPTLGYTLSRFVRRHAAAVVASAAALSLAGALVTFYTVSLAEAREAAVAESARTERIQRFMLDLFEGGDPAAGPSDTLRVVTLVDRGVVSAQALGADPAVQADLYETLGGIHQKLGNLGRADSLLTSALELRRRLFRGDGAEVGRTLVALGLLRVEQARLEEAEQMVSEGLDGVRRALPPRDPAVANALTGLGTVLQARGQYDDAIARLEEAARLAEGRAADDPDAAHTLAELANTYFYAGRYAVSDSLNQRLLLLYRQRYGERHPLVADALINLSAIQFQLGNYAAAEGYLRPSLDIYRAFYGSDHYETAATLNMLGQSLVYQDRPEEALDMLREGLAIRERVYGPVHPRVASSLNELGNASLRLKDLRAAESYFGRMLSIYEQVYGEKHYLIGIASSNLGSVQLEAARPELAEPLLRTAVQMFRETLSDDHLNTAIARVKLGRALVRQGKHAEAEPVILAGYERLAREANPSISYLRAAREDLVTAYEALNQPEQAARFRAELQAVAAGAPG